MHKVLIGLLALLLAGCSSISGGEGMQLRNIAKSDVDLVTELHYQQIDVLLRKLMIKLYKRNPDQLKKNFNVSIQQQVTRLFDKGKTDADTSVGVAEHLASMHLAMDSEYAGDRVFTLMRGLKGMLDESYNNQSEFYLLSSSLNENKLYKSARNIEVLLWMLSHRTDNNGRLLLFTNSIDGEPRNLSFERLFGKLIATQDMMSRITAQKNQRMINIVVHNAASMVFLPF